MQVTILENIYKTTEVHQIPLESALKRIKEGNSSTSIGKLRTGDKEVKKILPAVLFSGEFSSREDSALVQHSGFIVCDFDKLDDVQGVKDALAMDSFIHSCWVSPSGNGVKALVRVTNPERHKDHYRALERYFTDVYSLVLDPNGS